MKKIFSFIVFGLIAQLYAQVKPFEGTIVYTDKYANKDTVFTVIYKIQKNRFKVELGGDTRYVLTNESFCRLYFPENKSYFESTLKEQKKDEYNVNYWKDVTKLFKEGLTGETKTILGYLCQKISYFTPFDENNPSNGGRRYEYWVIKNRSAKILCRNTFNEFGLSYVDECLYFGYIPLEYTESFEYKDSSQNSTFTYEAVKIDDNKLPKDCFNVPKGFNRTEDTGDDDYYDYEY